jgi:hypothetical protein
MNFIYGKETQEVTLTNGSATDLLKLRLPGTKDSPQDWIIIATAEVSAYSASVANFVNYMTTKLIIDTTSPITVGTALTANFGLVAENSTNNKKWSRPMFVYYYKDFTGGASASYVDIKFNVQNNSSTPATNIGRVKNQSILAIKVPRELRDRILVHEESGSPLQALTSTPATFGSVTFTPDSGKYLIISTAQVDFNSTTGDTADVWYEVYQSENATSEAGATNLLLETVPPEHTTGSGIGHYTIIGDVTTNNLKYPVCLMSVVDLEDKPCTIVWKGDAISSIADVSSIRTIAIPLDSSFVNVAAYSPAIRINTNNASPTALIDSIPVGIAGKKTYCIVNSVLYPFGNAEYVLGRAAAGTAGEFITDVLSNNNYENDCAQLCGIQMISGVDTISAYVKRSSTELGLADAGEPYAKNTVLLAFTDLSSAQSAITITKDVEITYQIGVSERRNKIDYPTAKALEDVAEEGRSVYTIMESNIRDTNYELVHFTGSDTAYLFDGTDYIRDDY